MQNIRAVLVQAKYVSLAVVVILVIAVSSPALASNTTKGISYTGQNENTTNELNSTVLTGTAPAEYSNSSELVAHSSYQDHPATVARGDWLAIKLTATANSTTAPQSLPGKNLLYANPATPGANATHTAAIQINHTIDDVNSIKLDYGSDLRPSLQYNIGPGDIEHIGIDTDRDGLIETHLDSHVRSVLVTDSKSIQVRLNSSPIIESGSYVIIRYSGIQNPPGERSGKVNISLSGDGAATETGTIVYNSKYSGMVGSQTDLAVREVGANATPVLTLRPARTSLSDSKKIIFLPTKGYKAGSMYTVSFSSSKKAYILPRLSRTFANSRQVNESIKVSGLTTLAPGSTVGIHAYEPGLSSSGIYQRTTVDNSSFWSTELKLPNEMLRDKAIKIKVYDHSGKSIGNITSIGVGESDN